MVSGSVNRDSFGSVFRSLSQRQRHGILSVRTDFGSFNIAFQEGKIVFIERDEDLRSAEVCRKLVEGGLLAEKVVQAVSNSKVASQKLYELLVGKKYVSEEDYCLAERAYDFDLLHSLRLLREGEVEFTPRLIRLDASRGFSVYPGQALLDMIELEGDEERFAALFEGISSQTIRVRRSGSLSCRPTAEEMRLYQSLTAEMSVRELFRRSLLSRYHFVESLLSLCEQGVIVPVERDGRPRESDFSQTLDADVMRDEDDYIGQQIILRNTLEEAAMEADEDVSIQPSEEEEKGEVLPRGSEEDEDNKSSVQAPIANESHELDDVIFTGGSNSIANEKIRDSEETSLIMSCQSMEPVAVKERTRCRPSFRERITSANYFFSTPETKGEVVLYLMLIFIVTVALRGAVLFESWFAALNEFTSKL